MTFEEIAECLRELESMLTVPLDWYEPDPDDVAKYRLRQACYEAGQYMMMLSMDEFLIVSKAELQEAYDGR